MSSPKKTCFVIMPIGKEGTEEYDYHMGVYNAIIRPAVEGSGYTAKRADLSFETGNIPRQIISDLANCDLVVADLSERNANVYFELGIRHVLAKCGTIHIVEETKALPFDIAQYRAIKYSTHFTRIQAVHNTIREAIKAKEEASDRSDNPVHDALPLPASYLDTSSDDVREQVSSLQVELVQLREQNEALQAQLVQCQPLYHHAGEAEVESLIDGAIDRSIQELQNNPAQVILRIQELASEHKHEELLQQIRIALKSPFLEPSHIATIASVAQRSALRSVEIAVLEVGRLRFPGDVDFKRWLAQSYIHSSDFDLKRKGLAILEDHLGISRDTGGNITIGRPFVDDADGCLIIMSDYYHQTEQYDAERTLLEAGEKIWKDNNRVLRNLGRASVGLADTAKAEEYYKAAIKADPADDRALSWYANMIEKQGRYVEAFDLLTQASEADPDDMDYLIARGLFIFEHGHPDQLKEDSIPPLKDRIERCMPVFKEALSRSNNDPRVAFKITAIMANHDPRLARQLVASKETDMTQFASVPFDGEGHRSAR